MRLALLLSVTLLATAVIPAAVTAEKQRRSDLVWTAPDFARYDVRSIAFLPVAMYDHNLQDQNLVETAIGQSLKDTGYRFASTLVTKAWLQREGGDSLLKAVDAQLLKNARVDSAQAASLSHTLRARALLGVRVDRMERMQLEYNQSGKPTTTIELHAALVDSTGHLLWTATGAETMEGQYQDAANGSQGVSASGLNNTFATNRVGAPTFPEVLARLMARWTPQFPARPAPSAP